MPEFRFTHRHLTYAQYWNPVNSGGIPIWQQFEGSGNGTNHVELTWPFECLFVEPQIFNHIIPLCGIHPLPSNCKLVGLRCSAAQSSRRRSLQTATKHRPATFGSRRRSPRRNRMVHGCISRKKRTPLVAGMLISQLAPTTLTVLVMLVQLVVLKLEFHCSVNPG